MSKQDILLTRLGLMVGSFLRFLGEDAGLYI